jgi:hypothetical protein
MAHNITPVFMKHCITAWRKDYKLVWAVLQTEREVFGTAHELANYSQILNRPKTPKWLAKGYAKVWLASNFRPVSDALFDGATDEEAMAIWRKTDKNIVDRGLRKEMSKEDDAIHRERRVYVRETFNTHGAFFEPK